MKSRRKKRVKPGNPVLARGVPKKTEGSEGEEKGG